MSDLLLPSESAVSSASGHTSLPVDGFIDIPGGKTHYLDWGGKGPEAHMLHANGFCAGVYDPFVRHLTGDLRVLGTDIRGHGDSSRYEADRITHWRLFADDLTRFIREKMTPPVIGIGHSLGAVTTFIAAAQSPHLFSGIVLIDPVILPRRLLFVMRLLYLTGLLGKFPLAKGARRRKRVFEGKQAARKRFTSGRGIFKTWSGEFIDAYLECGFLEEDENTATLKCDPELEAQIFESAPRDAWTYARKIQCPVLAVRGETSDTFYPDAARNLGGYIPDYTLVTIPGTGHFVPMEKPEACAGEILAFLRAKGLLVG
ncbi:MAG: alpha/beta hydrolase [Desulfobacterales bacterium]|nr:alpha/beta hydrolase [Desulfobacterales bacterium]